MPPAIIIALREARSINAMSKGKFKTDLAGEARRSVELPLTGPRLYSKVCYFYRGINTVDADNMSKPVLDALKGIAYKDDNQVVVRLAAKVALDTDAYNIVSHPDTLRQHTQLLHVLQSERHVLYIEIGELSAVRMTVGEPL